MRGLCLMYHDVHEGTMPRGGVPATAAIYHVSEAAFRRHLDILAAAGVPTQTVGEYAAHRSAPGDSFVLTFDDGWASSLSLGVERLVEAAVRATFFITRDYVGRPSFASSALLRDAHAAGMELGTHGATHRFLERLPVQELRAELASSKAFLEEVVGAAVTTGSVPGGAWSPEVGRIARECGYEALCTSRPGLNGPRTDPLALRRVAIRRTTTDAALERYARFRVGREVVRDLAFDVPRRLLGRERYAALRARLLGGARA